jgi:xyloglucan-specific endo-beta-1,4-glucanase
MSSLLPPARLAPRRRARLITLLTVALTTGLAAALTLVPAAAQAATTCGSGASEGMNPYYILDNEYNSSLATSSSWQCVWSTSQSGNTIVWGADWDWAHASSSTSSDVLAYPAAVLGWEWGWQYSDTKLPVRLSSGTTVSSTWNYTFTQNTANTFDVSYDNWITSSSDPGDANPQAEMMIWLNHGGGAGPAGSQEATVSVDGASWNLYVDTNNTWPIYSFVRTSTTTSSSLTITDFTKVLTGSYGLNSSYYLSSVQAGVEVWTGEGQIDSNSYSVTVG